MFVVVYKSQGEIGVGNKVLEEHFAIKHDYLLKQLTISALVKANIWSIYRYIR